MAKTVFVVTDIELGKIVGIYDNEEAADECEAAAPGDRLIEEWPIQRVYDEEQDDRFFDESIDGDDESLRDPFDDNKLYADDDPYGD